MVLALCLGGLGVGAAQAQGAATGERVSASSDIGVVDVQRILAEAHASQALMRQREEVISRFQNEAAEEEKALQQADQDLAQSRGEVSVEVFRERVEEFQRRVAESQRRVQIRRRNLELAFGQAMQRLQDVVTAITQDIAAERGMTLILYRSQIFLMNEQLDITEDVLQRVNQHLPTIAMPDPDSLPQDSDSLLPMGGR